MSAASLLWIDDVWVWHCIFNVGFHDWAEIKLTCCGKVISPGLTEVRFWCTKATSVEPRHHPVISKATEGYEPTAKGVSTYSKFPTWIFYFKHRLSGCTSWWFTAAGTCREKKKHIRFHFHSWDWIITELILRKGDCLCVLLVTGLRNTCNVSVSAPWLQIQEAWSRFVITEKGKCR